MRIQSLWKLVLSGVLMLAALVPATALADDDWSLSRLDNNRDHFEVSFGFLAGQRALNDSTFTWDSGNAPASLVEPFTQAPFDSTNVYGLRYDLRAVVSHVRMLIGFDLPFSSFNAGATRRTYRVDGIDREVVIQNISPYELRFGLGGEYQFGRVAPFLDLVGVAHWTDVDLTVDGDKATFRSNGFGFAIRAGVRVHLREWFFASVSGEIGVAGPVRWNADLSVGVAVF